MSSKNLETIVVLKTVEKAISNCLSVQEPSGSPDSLPELTTSSMSYRGHKYTWGNKVSVFGEFKVHRLHSQVSTGWKIVPTHRQPSGNLFTVHT